MPTGSRRITSGDGAGFKSANKAFAVLEPTSGAKRRAPSAIIVPGRAALFAAIVLALILLGVLIEPGLAYVAVAGDLALIALVLVDGLRLSKMPVSVQREESRRLQLGRSAEFVYRVENRSTSTAIVSLRQPWPASFESDEDRLEVLVQPGEVVRAAFAATPRRRGRVSLAPAEADLRFPHGLARRRWTAGEEERLSIYPDLKGLSEYDNLRRSHALNQLGIHRQRMLGEGREFEELRQYLPDDDFRHINWKATARHRYPMTNVYQAERSQDVLLCLDCGRMMSNPVGKGTAMDRAVDASVMLTHVAWRQGDRSGLVLFRDAVNLFLKPKRSVRAMNQIIEELVDVEPEPVFPSYAALAQSIQVCHKHRSMIFLFTDLNDPQLAADLANVMPLLSRRHIVIVISLRDPLLERAAVGPAAGREQLYQVLAARALASERDARARDLSRHGVQVLEADGDSLTIEVINRYLSVKMRQLA